MHLQPRYQDNQWRLASIMGYEGGKRRGEEMKAGDEKEERLEETRRRSEPAERKTLNRAAV